MQPLFVELLWENIHLLVRSVVTKDVPPFSLVIGNPGKIVGKVDKKGMVL